MDRASGRFIVKITPQAAEDGVGDASIGRMPLHKRFEGGLHGRRGGFSLHHLGIMDRGQSALDVRIVPDSGSGELTGIRGRLAIRIEGKEHFISMTSSTSFPRPSFAA